jgi:hypothetical protein
MRYIVKEPPRMTTPAAIRKSLIARLHSDPVLEKPGPVVWSQLIEDVPHVTFKEFALEVFEMKEEGLLGVTPKGEYFLTSEGEDLKTV